MEMKVMTSGMGLGIPRTNLQASIFCIGAIFIRENIKAGTKHAYVIKDDLNIGGKSGTFLFNCVETSWFYLDQSKYNWLLYSNNLLNHLLEIKLEGEAMLNKEAVDISITLFDVLDQPIVLTAKCCIQAEGMQFSPITIRGKLEIHPDYM